MGQNSLYPNPNPFTGTVVHATRGSEKMAQDKREEGPLAPPPSMKCTIHGNRLPRDMQVKKVENHCSRDTLFFQLLNGWTILCADHIQSSLAPFQSKQERFPPGVVHLFSPWKVNFKS